MDQLGQSKTTGAHEQAELALPPLKRSGRYDDYIFEILDRELGLTLHGVRVGSPRDDSMRELTNTTATLYAGRIFRELIQNAYDGSEASQRASILLRLDLREGPFGVLYVANNGDGFARDNVDAIVNPAQSNKRPGGGSIGHKGLGFRSVILISDDPQVFSAAGEGRPRPQGFDGYCFGFAHPADERARLEGLHAGELTDKVVGKTHRLQLPVPITQQSKEVIDFAAKGFSTLIRVPLRDAKALERADKEWRYLFDEKAPLALFLDRAESLVLERISADGTVDRRSIGRRRRPLVGYEASPDLRVEEVTVDRQRFLIAHREVSRERFRTAVRAAIEAQYPLEKWLEWEGSPKVAIALPISSDAREGRFYAFLPMDTPSPFNGFLDAPFFPNPDRNGLSLDNPLNSMLLDVVGEVCVALARAASDANETRQDVVHAAVDAVAWGSQERAYLLKALDAVGLDAGGIPAPAARRSESASRWSTLADVYDWDDGEYAVLKASLLARVLDLPMLRQGLGEKRAHALTKLASEEDVPLLPADTVWKTWAPAIAQYLHRQKRPATAWTQFYADLAKLRDPLPHLRGAAIFVAQGGKLVPANNPLAVGDGPEFFIHQEAERPNRRRKRLSDAALFPPDSLARNMLFSDPLIGWSPQVAQAFIGAGLASEYSLPTVVSKLGRLVGKRPPHLRVLAAVGWAFDAWKTHRTPELESSLRTSNLRLPAGAGGNQPAGRLRFSAGWRDSQGDLIAELVDAAAAVSREIADIGASVLPTWDAWPLRERGSASEWTQFLKHCGVRDGLPVLTHKAVSVEKWQWAGIKKGDGPELPIERALGAIWRADVKEQSTWGFRYNSGAYSTEQTLYVFAGQSAYASFPVQAKLPYARLIARFLLDADTKYFNTRLTRTAGNPDTDLWPSPLAAFLRQQAWTPLAGVDDVEWARPKNCWYAPKGEADVLPRFVQRLERGMREALDGSAALRTTMVERLGLRLWSAEVTAGDRVATLGAALAKGISEAEHDTFRKAYREAWEHWSALTSPPALPSELVLAVDLGGRLIALPPPAPDQDALPLLVGETSNPTLTQLLTVIDRPVFSAPDGKSAVCAAAIKRAQGRDVELLEGVELGVEVDGQSFAPSADPPLLVSVGREWLAEISVLVLEFNTGLTNRNTARSRQLLYDDLRKVRVVSAQDVAVTIAGERGGLPVGLEGVLPISHADFPTLVVAEAPPEMDWATLARLGSGLALAIGRPGLSLQFRVAFLALSNALAPLHAPFERPEDALVARALAQPVSRVRELYRSLRSTTGRLLDGLIPSVQLRFGTAAAEALLTRRAEFTDEADIAAVLVARGVPPQQVADLIDICRDADGLDDVRQRLGADLASFNAALSALGGEWSPLRFDERLRRQFTTRQEELRALLAQTVRDAYVDLFDADGDLMAYRRDSRLDWITFDERWLETYDNLPDELIDARFADLGQSHLPASSASADDGLESLRQANRTALVANLPELRRVARAWVAKEPILRGLPLSWEATNDIFVRGIVSSGVLDFRRIAMGAWPAALARASAWPTAMPASLDLEMLGLIDSDLELEEQQETKRREAELKARRTIAFGEIEVDGGQSDRFDQVAAALRDALASSSFRERSGKADLQAFGPKGPRRPGRRGGGKAKDPEYLSEEQRTLLGFAGELAAYHYLKQSVRGFNDACWLSSMGRRYLGLSATNDSDGYDFKVPRTRGDLYFEVKAHVGDPGYVDLERSQVAAAASMASEKRGKWRVLYVSNVQTPELIAVSELPNPFSEDGKVYFREGQHPAVRLKLRRAN